MVRQQLPSAALLHHTLTADPASPPDTPTASPQLSRKTSLHPQDRSQHCGNATDIYNLANDPNIKPVGGGDGHQFSYQPNTAGPVIVQLSPRDSDINFCGGVDRDEDENVILVDEDSEIFDRAPSQGSVGTAKQSMENSTGSLRLVLASPDEDDENDDEMRLGHGLYGNRQATNQHGSFGNNNNEGYDEENGNDDDYEGDNEAAVERGPADISDIPINAAAALFSFTIEELHPMDADDDWDTLSVIQPYEIEIARSRSCSLNMDNLDHGMMRDLRNLNCSGSTSDGGAGNATDTDTDTDTDMDAESPPYFTPDEEAFYRRQRELRRMRRVSMSSSVSKRTHSELSDSDSDDRLGPLGVDDMGSSARRMRKRLHRTSLLFQDPPEQIEEEEEPDSDEEKGMGEMGGRRRRGGGGGLGNDGGELCRELPYWTMEVMEIDDS